MDHKKLYAGQLIALLAAVGCSTLLYAAPRKIDPTFLYRKASAVQKKKSDITTATCHYKPFFGKGDADSFAVAGIARYGEAVIDPHGACATVQYPQEDQIYVVLKGEGSVKYGNDTVPLNTEDYVYLPSTIPHALKNTSGTPMTVVIMGYHTKGYEKAPIPPHALKDNIENVPTQLVKGHPAAARFRLLLGDINSKRDRIEAGRVVTSLFLMEIAPNGTNFPHHHERAEEIYLVLSGHGTMVAGGGMNGIAGRHPAKAGDAYFFRQNCTVGYYSASGVKSRILAVRSWYPGMQQEDR